MLTIRGKELYDLTELAGILKLHRRTVQEYLIEGRIKAAKIGGKWYVHEDALERYVRGETT